MIVSGVCWCVFCGGEMMAVSGGRAGGGYLTTTFPSQSLHS